MLLQIMEEGRLTDSFGRHVDFRNTILLMTSNIGASVIKDQATMGFTRGSADRSYEEMKSQLMKAVSRHFRPEFLNRLDDTIVFRPLSREDMTIIVEYEFANVRGRLVDRGLAIEMTPEAKAFLIDKGFDPDFGARPMRRAIEQHIEDPLSEAILKGEFEGKNHITVTVKDGHLYFDAEMREKEEERTPVATGSENGD